MLFQSRYMPCPDCGASVDQVEDDLHVCDEERRLGYELFQLRAEIEQLDGGFARYLDSPRGRFEQWYAERTRPA